MKFDFRFNITFKCKKYNKTEFVDNPEIEYVELLLNKNTASNFIFRHKSSIFIIPDSNYQVILKFDTKSNLIGIGLADENYYYIVSDFEQVLDEIIKGYTNICLIENNPLLSGIIDTELGYNDNTGGIIDEFAYQE